MVETRCSSIGSLNDLAADATFLRNSGPARRANSSTLYARTYSGANGDFCQAIAREAAGGGVATVRSISNFPYAPVWSVGVFWTRKVHKGIHPMPVDVQLCEAIYNEFGRDECLRRAYRAYLRQRTWRLVKHALNGEEIGLACLLDQAAVQESHRPEV